MIAIDMPPSYLKNSDAVRVESFLEGTTAHRLGCLQLRNVGRVVSVAQALVFLHVQWCHRCMGRQGC